MLFLSLKEMATGCNKDAEAKKWSEAAYALGDFHKQADGKQASILVCLIT